MPTTATPTPTTAYIYYGVLNSHTLLICCYHSGRMNSLAFYSLYSQQLNLQYTRQLNKDKSPIKIFPKYKCTSVTIKDSRDYDLVEQAVLTALKNIKEQLNESNQEFREVSFYADVNLCFLDKLEIARFFMDNTLATIFQVPVSCVLETTLTAVAKKAAEHHQKHYKSKVTIRTKEKGSDGKYTYPDDSNELSENTVTKISDETLTKAKEITEIIETTSKLEDEIKDELNQVKKKRRLLEPQTGVDAVDIPNTSSST
ncbi:hypothetical protein ACQUW5_12270 [Legionella sp. CNM-1927-20]|uniref:hypothetical protein n=1 Tax=Legionella sp. CNM-1927-20 TaxID=3422221 RepID=UPI00403AAE8B